MKKKCLFLTILFIAMVFIGMPKVEATMIDTLETLANCLNATQDGNTITLRGDATLGDSDEVLILDDIIIDLNTFTLTSNAADGIEIRGQMSTIKNGIIHGRLKYSQTLTIENTIITMLDGEARSHAIIKKNVTLNNLTYGNITIENGATLIIDSKDFVFGCYDYPNGRLLTNNGTILIKDSNSVFTIDSGNNILNNGTIANYGTFTNNGTLAVASTGRIVNNPYKLEKLAMTNGTIESDIYYSSGDETITLTTIPEEGCRLKNGTLKVMNGQNEIPLTEVDDTTYTFTMPSADVTVFAEFENIYRIIKGEPTNGSFDVGKSLAVREETVTIITRPYVGYRVKSVKVNGSEAGVTNNAVNYTFAISNEDVTISVEFEEMLNLETVEIAWQKNYGGTRGDIFNQIIETTDGGYVVVGNTWSTDIVGLTSMGNRDAIIVKYDSSGNIVWQKNYGGTTDDSFYQVIETTDGGYVAVGITSSDISGLTNNGDVDAIIVKYDTNGNMIWQNNYGGAEIDEFLSITEAADGGYIVVGNTLSTDIRGLTSKEMIDAIIVKYDTNGNMIWQKNYGGTDNDFFSSVLVTTDGGFIAVGNSNSTIPGLTPNGWSDAIIVKYNESGEVSWQKNYGGTTEESFNSVTETTDGGFVVVGYSESDIDGLTNLGVRDAIIVKYNESGIMEWQRNYGGTGGDTFNSVGETADGGYIAVGYSKSNINGLVSHGDFDGIIVKYDEDGVALWQKNHGGPAADYFKSVIETSDGCYIAVGQSDGDAVVVKYAIFYDIIKNSTNNGSFNVDKTIANSGATVTITTTPNDGYKVKTVKVNDSTNGVRKVNSTTYTFEMPQENTEVSVEFEKVSTGGTSTPTYKITVIQNENGEISPNESIRVTKNKNKEFTIKPNEGYEIQDVLVDGESIGKVPTYTFEKVTEAHTIEAKFKKTTIPYIDVFENDWFSEEVIYVTRKGIMKGIGSNKFDPNGKITRAMIVTALYNLENEPEIDYKSSFTDVEEGTWYAKQIAWAEKNKIVNGFGDGTFEPNKEATREQLAVIILNYINYKNIEKPTENTELDFVDSNEISQWAKDAVKTMKAMSIMQGKDGNMFDALGYATRAEIATMIMNFCERCDIGTIMHKYLK